MDDFDKPGRKDSKKYGTGNHNEEGKPVNHRTGIPDMGPLWINLSKKDSFQHPHQIEHCDCNPKNRNDGLNRIDTPAPNDDHQFAHKIDRPGKPEGCSHSHYENPCNERHIFRQTSVIRNIPCVGLVINKPRNGEEHSRGQRMGKHEENRPGHTDHIQCGHSQEDITHMTTTRISNDILGILLEESHQPSVDNRKNAKHRRHPHPFPGCIGKNIISYSDNGKMTEFHQNTRVKHARCRRSRGMAHRGPGMQRP